MRVEIFANFIIIERLSRLPFYSKNIDISFLLSKTAKGCRSNLGHQRIARLCIEEKCEVIVPDASRGTSSPRTTDVIRQSLRNTARLKCPDTSLELLVRVFGLNTEGTAFPEKRSATFLPETGRVRPLVIKGCKGYRTPGGKSLFAAGYSME